MVPVLVPNNNLEFARRAIRQDPNLFNHPAEGPLLTQFKDILTGDNKLSQCLDISSNASRSELLCSQTNDESARTSVLLLLAVLNSSCTTGVFCGYFFVPLQRTGGA
jgi:hypothetical protein